MKGRSPHWGAIHQVGNGTWVLAEDIMSTKTLTYRGVKYIRTNPTLNSIHSVWVSRDENKKEREQFQAKLERERLK
jgi:hypothetical protein|tara:strand:+ start:3045 stop:3272 length:228 start_codon:yes stop_codon:yes gene_type:complete